jgi:hypothetical protein
VAEVVHIEGLREFQASLRRIDSGLPKTLRLVLNDAAEVVVEGAQQLVPHRSGAARGSIRAASTQREARVRAGGARAPYYPWLDFGGAVGRANSVRRPFLRDGRYIYPTLDRRRAWFEKRLSDGLVKLVESSGLAVD